MKRTCKFYYRGNVYKDKMFKGFRRQEHSFIGKKEVMVLRIQAGLNAFILTLPTSDQNHAVNCL